MRVLRSLLFYFVFYTGSALLVSAAVIMLRLSRQAMIAICNGWSHFHHWCVENLLGIRVEITGSRPPGAVLYAIKHESFFEAIEIPHLFSYPSGFAKKELFDIPGWGAAARSYGAVPVARDEGAKTLRMMLKEARPFVEEGRPIIIFPEGTRVPHGEAPPLQSGFAALYKMLGVPVVPVAVDSGPRYQTIWKRPGTIRVHFGEVIPPGLSREEAEARTHAAINIFNA